MSNFYKVYSASRHGIYRDTYSSESMIRKSVSRSVVSHCVMHMLNALQNMNQEITEHLTEYAEQGEMRHHEGLQ